MSMRLTGRSSAEEAFSLYTSPNHYFADDESDPGWHHQFGEEGGPELTIAIEK